MIETKEKVEYINKQELCRLVINKMKESGSPSLTSTINLKHFVEILEQLSFTEETASWIKVGADIKCSWCLSDHLYNIKGEPVYSSRCPSCGKVMEEPEYERF